MSLLPASSVHKAVMQREHCSPVATQAVTAPVSMALLAAECGSAELQPLPGAMWVVVLSGAVAGSVAMPQ